MIVVLVMMLTAVQYQPRALYAYVHIVYVGALLQTWHWVCHLMGAPHFYLAASSGNYEI